MNAKVKGYLLGAVAAATYGTNPLFALPLYADGMDADSVLFFRYLFGVPMIAALMLGRGRRLSVSRGAWIPLIFLGVMVALSSLMLFMSYNYMDAAIASTLLFVYPLMVAVFMAVFFRERLSMLTVGCILVATAGVGLLCRGSEGFTLSLTGLLLVMVSSVTYSIYIIGVNRPGLREIPTLSVVLVALIVGVAVFGAKILFTPGGSILVPGYWYMWGCVIGLALLPTVVSFVCTTVAIQYIGPTPTAILGVLEPVTAVAIGVAVFGETLTGRDWLGLLLILASVTVVVSGGKITAPLVRFRKMFPRLPLRRHRRQ